MEIAATHRPQYEFRYNLPKIGEVKYSIPINIETYNINADLISSELKKQGVDLSLYGIDIKSIPINFNELINADYNIPSQSGQTYTSSTIAMLNLIYQFNPVIYQIKPFILVGAGVARVNIKPIIASYKVQIFDIVSGDIAIIRLNKNPKNYLAFALGFGVAKDLTQDLEMRLSAKVQAINNVEIKYDLLDIKAYKFATQRPIKQIVGFGEFTLSFNYKLPL